MSQISLVSLGLASAAQRCAEIERQKYDRRGHTNGGRRNHWEGPQNRRHKILYAAPGRRPVGVARRISSPCPRERRIESTIIARRRLVPIAEIERIEAEGRIARVA